MGRINEVSFFKNTNLEKLEETVNGYIESCVGDIDIVDIKYNVVVLPDAIDNVEYSVMIIHSAIYDYRTGKLLNEYADEEDEE